MTQEIDIAGQRFGLLTAVARAGSNQWGRVIWLCQCDCGGAKTVLGYSLRAGRAKSCGCRHSTHKHGEAKKSPEHNIWAGMRGRCNSLGTIGYEHYGGRGIKVCQRWNDFQAFLEDMGRRPSPRHSLDRIDVDGDYEPGNCRWTTPDIQQHGKRSRSNTGFQGVSLAARTGRYVWAVSRNGRRICGGATTLEAAVAARADAERTLYANDHGANHD